MGANRNDHATDDGGSRRQWVLAVFLTALMVTTPVSAAAASATSSADRGVIRPAAGTTTGATLTHATASNDRSTADRPTAERTAARTAGSERRSPARTADREDAAGGATPAPDPGVDCDVPLFETDTEGGLGISVLQELNATKAAQRCGGTTITVPTNASQVEIKLIGPREEATDFDLFLTLDGRRPSLTDYDIRSSEDSDRNESVILREDQIPGNGRIGVAMLAYSGAGRPTISVEYQEGPPVARIEGPSNVTPGSSATFNGSHSLAPNGTASYEWRVDGTLVDTGPEFTASASRATTGGVYNVSLRVRDTNGNVDNVTRRIEVTSGPLPDADAKIRVNADPEPLAVGSTPEFVTPNPSDRCKGPTTLVGVKWDFGDGDSKFDTDVDHIIDKKGTTFARQTVFCRNSGTGEMYVDSVRRNISTQLVAVEIQRVKQNRFMLSPINFFMGCGPMGRVKVNVSGTGTIDKVELTTDRRLADGKPNLTKSSPTSSGWYSFNRGEFKRTGGTINPGTPIFDYITGDANGIYVTAKTTSGESDTEIFNPRFATAPSLPKLVFQSFQDAVLASTAIPNSQITGCRVFLGLPGYSRSGNRTVNGANLINALPFGGSIGSFMPSSLMSSSTVGFELTGGVELAYYPKANQLYGGIRVLANLTFPRNVTIEGYVRGGLYWGLTQFNIWPDAAGVGLGVTGQVDIANFYTPSVNIPGWISSWSPIPGSIDFPLDFVIETGIQGRAKFRFDSVNLSSASSCDPEWRTRSAPAAGPGPPARSCPAEDPDVLNLSNSTLQARFDPIVRASLQAGFDTGELPIPGTGVEAYLTLEIKMSWMTLYEPASGPFGKPAPNGFCIPSCSTPATTIDFFIEVGIRIDFMGWQFSPNLRWNFASVPLRRMTGTVTGGVAGGVPAAVSTGSREGVHQTQRRPPGLGQKRSDTSPAAALAGNTTAVVDGPEDIVEDPAALSPAV